MTVHRLVIDEAGLRHQVGEEEPRYILFSNVANVELRTRILRDPILVLIDTQGEEHVVFAGGEALEIHKALAEHTATARPLRPVEHWPREGRPIMAWLESLGASASDTYRASGDVCTLALAVLADASAAIEDRAAAAYLLVSTADDDDLVATAKIYATRSLPPLVNIAPCFADGGGSIANVSAVPFCEPEDRAAWLAHRRGLTDRHSKAAFEAKQQIGAETQRFLSATAQEKRAAGHHGPAAYRDMSKWVGKSWGL